MLEFYWGCLIFGVLFAILSVLVGEVFSDMFDGIFEFLSIDGPNYIQPMVIVGFITSFGGAGVLLTEKLNWPQYFIILLALFIALLLAAIVYFSYVKPMNQAESSTGFSYQDLIGKIGEVTIPLPAKGYGEVILLIGGGNTNQIAASFDSEEIPAGEKVVVVSIEEETLMVSKLNDL